ncbi:MAG: DNA polymerase III subunit gamma/tau [Sphaerochaetaceae bacterium]|jgi:DNA polymerase-3 subunit gamma/tau
MAYEVTATRKRPQAFDTLVGQEFVVSTITNAIEQGRIAHAYLFSGPRGVGKTTSARILAKALNCVHGPTPHPCGVCENCREITQGNSMDVIEIDGASNTSVNDVRTIKDEVLFPPQSSRYKIYIIDEVHMLSTSAFNALLKTIEEPPEYVVFIFATTETQKVPATIRSRCQQFHFQLISLETIKGRLAEAAADLNVEADDDALFWIAKEATGSMRDAYTLFDQVVSFSNGHITLAQIQDKLGLVGIDQISSLLSSLLSGDSGGALLGLQELLGKGISVEQCTKDFAQYFRALLLMKKGVTDADVLGEQPQRFPDPIKNAYTEEQLEAAVELFLRLYRDIRYSLNPRLELELAVSRLESLPYLVSPVILMEKLAKMKNDLLAGNMTPENPDLAGRIPSLPFAKPAATIPERTPRIAAHADRPVPTESKEQNQAPSTDARRDSMEVRTPPLRTTQPERRDTDAPFPRQKDNIARKEPSEDIEPAQAPSNQKQPRPFMKEDIPALKNLLEESKERAATLMGQLVDCFVENGTLKFVFSSKFCVDQAKTDIAVFRKAIETICGYTGPLEFIVQRQENKPRSAAQTDETITRIANMFRGEIVG